MSGRKNLLVICGFVAAVSLIASAVSVQLFTYYYSRQQFDLVNSVCRIMVEQEPEALKIISAALKEFKDGDVEGNIERNEDVNAKCNNEGNTGAGAIVNNERTEIVSAESTNEMIAESNTGRMEERDILGSLGYGVFDLSKAVFVRSLLYTGAGILTGLALFCFTFLYRNRKEAGRVQALADYLEQAEAGRAAVLAATGEDAFSKLEDAIYKTVTSLYQTRDSAVQARNDFAENLSNIAHQIKTPITAISLSVQMIKQKSSSSHVEQVEKQLLRLTHLEEALLVLSRIDAGTLVLQKKEVDVFTLLVLAADNLQEFFTGSGASADIPELGEMMITADLDWTMEAVMNLMKNCLEHGNGGVVHCSYEQNPLYTEILIWDEGEGFAKEDIPYIFERFYRGKDAGEGGIGIGLALAREIIERQNGTIRAENRQEGGACFEIHFYRH